MKQEEIDRNYNYHAPKGTQQSRYEVLRAKAKELAELANDACPESREKSVGFTNLETAMFWFNASIARNE